MRVSICVYTMCCLAGGWLCAVGRCLFYLKSGLILVVFGRLCLVGAPALGVLSIGWI